MSREDQDVLFYAFRYALGRKTGVVGFMVELILKRWDKISDRDKRQMKDEIQYAINMDTAGQSCDIEQWKKILEKSL